jgi:hypothetical protein
MVRRVLGFVIVCITVASFAACGGGRTNNAQPSAEMAPHARRVDVALSLDLGRARALYSVRGRHYGTVGRLVAACSSRGVPRTEYVLERPIVDAVVAVDGRGTSRAVQLHSGSRRLQGGTKRAGIEQWIVITGGEPESIRLDASVLVRPVAGLGCEFSMQGAVVVTSH